MPLVKTLAAHHRFRKMPDVPLGIKNTASLRSVDSFQHELLDTKTLLLLYFFNIYFDIYFGHASLFAKACL